MAVSNAGAPVVSLSFGDSTPHVERVHDADATLLATVGSAAEAERAAVAGVDAVVAQGWEAGGHVRNDVATMALVPAVVAVSHYGREPADQPPTVGRRPCRVVARNGRLRKCF